MRRIRLYICALGVLLGLAPASAFSDTVFSQTSIGTPGDSGGIYPSQFLATSWTATGSYSNVSISAEVGDYICAITNCGITYTSTIDAYLTTAIGPSRAISNAPFTGPQETVADQIAVGTVTVGPSAGPEWDTLFSGLSLAPGTYFLVLANGTGSDYWFGTNGQGGAITTTTGTGVTFDGEYASGSIFGAINGSNPPDSDWSGPSVGDFGLSFQVTGDPSSGSGSGSPVPEPSSISLLLAGMAGGLYLLRRQLKA